MSVTVLSLDEEILLADAWLARHPGRVTIDTETTGLDVFADEFECGAVAIGVSSGDALVLEGRATGLVKHVLRTVFTDPSRRVWAHNATYDAWVIRRMYGIALSSLRDSVTAAQVCWPNRAGGYSLKALRPTTQDAQDALREEWADRAADFDAPTPRGGEASWLPVAVRHLRVRTSEALAAYVAEDVVETARLVDEVAASLATQAPALRQVEVDQEWRWAGYQGIRIDRDLLDESIEKIETALEDARPQFDGVEVWRNTNARMEWLAAHGIVPPRDLKTNAPTLSKKWRKLAEIPPGKESLWEAACNAMATAGILPKLEEIRRAAGDGDRVHPSIGAITPRGATGRMSVRGPALQNLSGDDVLGVGSLRGVLLADEGRVLVGADLSHVEPSMLAALTADPVLTAAVQRDRDPYVETAVAAWGPGAAERDASGALTPEAAKLRKRAKVVLLALMYGMGDRSLALGLSVDQRQARRVRERVLGEWRGVARWIEQVRRDARRGHQQFTLGRRPIADVRTRPYLATNYLIQGSAADLFKMMASDARRELPRGARLWLPVHDELVIECEPGQADEVADILTRSMSVEISGVPIWGEPEVLGSRWRK